MNSTLEEENVRVVVRIRPMQTMEKKNGDISCVKANADGKEVQVKVGPLDAQVYKCNQCFPCDTSQALFFSESGITDLLDSAIQGYRACAFAFGQTGAGKTFTMVGPSKGIHHKDKQIGMIARSLEYVFMRLNSMNVQYNVKIACTEIYHENVFDLFADERERVSLPVREHSTDGFFLEGCKMVECTDYEVACAALDVAMRNRITGGHDMNSRSSRSHCLTEIYIEIPSKPTTASNIISELNEEGAAGEAQFITRGRMSLVDLAGSERLKSTNSTGKVLHEAGFINRSLYVLGKVIAGLVRTNGDLNHKDVPYRDSKLTKLLISSLGGRCHTLLISCVSEAKGSQNETLRTLKFSMSCARIRNKPVKFLDPQDRLILDLREEIRRLQTENKKLRSTILTAPAHLSASDDELGGAISGGSGVGGGLIGSGQKKQHHRALSAHSSLSPQNKKKNHSNVRMRGGGGLSNNARGSPTKKQLITANKMKKSHSDFVAQLGRRKDTRTLEMALRGLDYEQQQHQHLHGMQHGGGAASSSILDSRIVEGSDEDNHTRGSKGSKGSKGGYQQYSSPQRAAQRTTEEREETNDEGDEESSYDSVMSAAKKKMNQAQLEDLVRRRATGPMVFKTNEPLGPVRQTHASPMNNYERAMEASRIEKLEKRIAKMEKMEARRRKEQEAAAAAGDNHHSHGHLQKNHVTLDKYLSVQEGQSPARRVVDHSDVDESSVASSVVRGGGEHIATSAAAIVEGASPKKRKVKKSKAAAPAQNKDSPYLAHKNKPTKQAKPKAAPAAPEGIAAAPSVNVSSNVSIASHHSQLQDDIMAELEEYGLAGPTTHDPVAPPPPKKKTTRAAAAVPTAGARAAPLPVIKTEGKIKKAKPASQNIKLPELITKQPPAAPAAKSKAKPISHIASSPKKIKKSSFDLSSPPPSSPHTNFNRMQGGGSSKTLSPAVEAVKSKLAVLERSLTAKQIEFEDNPGEVTREAEEQLVALKQEAREMRKELEIASGNYDYEEDDFEPDEEEEEQEERYPAAATASAAAAVGFSGLSPSNKPAPISINTSNSGLAVGGNTSYPPTPQAVKDVAFDIQTIGSSGGGGGSSTKKRVKTPGVMKSPVKAADENYEDDDGYGDADFEADDEEGEQDKKQQQQVPVKSSSVDFSTKAASPVKAPEATVSVKKLTINTATTPTASNTAVNNQNNYREPASTTSLLSNEAVFPYNPSPLKSEQPSTSTSSKNSGPATSTGYSPSTKQQQQQQPVLTKETSSRKVLPPPKKVESDDDDDYDNDIDHKDDPEKAKEEEEEEEDYFTQLYKNKAAAAASVKRDPNVAAISLLKQNSGTSLGGSVKATVTPTKPIPAFPVSMIQPTPPAAAVPPVVVATPAPVATTVTPVAPPSVKKPSTAHSEDNYYDEGFEETALDDMPEHTNNNQSDEEDEEDFGSAAAAKSKAKAVESVKASPSTKTTSPVKSSNVSSVSNNRPDPADDDEDNVDGPLDTGYGADEFDEYEVSFEN